MSHNPSLSEEIAVQKAKYARYGKNPCGGFSKFISICEQWSPKKKFVSADTRFLLLAKNEICDMFSSFDLASAVFELINIA